MALPPHLATKIDKAISGLIEHIAREVRVQAAGPFAASPHAISTALRVTVPEAAKILGVSRTRLYNHIKEGTIKATKDGGRTLFTTKELQRFVVAQG